MPHPLPHLPTPPRPVRPLSRARNALFGVLGFLRVGDPFVLVLVLVNVLEQFGLALVIGLLRSDPFDLGLGLELLLDHEPQPLVRLVVHKELFRELDELVELDEPGPSSGVPEFKI